MGDQLDVGYDSTPQKRASRPNKAGGISVSDDSCLNTLSCHRWKTVDGRWKTIFKGLFKKQLHSNYLPLAVLSHTSLTTGIAVLFSYDTILTLPAEIQFVWKSRIRLPSVLYIIARYFFLIQRICYVVFDWADGPLELLTGWPRHILAQITQPRMDLRDITGKGLRYKQKSEIPFNTDIVNISRRTFLPCGVQKFIAYVWRAPVDMIVIDTAISTLTITFDGLILFTTLFYTIGTIRLQRDIKGLRKRSITYLIVQQGVLRFVLSQPHFQASVPTWRIGNISILLICRFFLDVRELNSSCHAINQMNSFVVTTFPAAEILFRVHLTKGNSSFIPQRGVRKPMVVRELKAMVHGDAISTEYYE
ncbi:hypothetical protein BU17DRAFT_67665 [Hysterangium stoloniferum]|nr:hypothetical protein BU17DRAFT_67665 [Hysterangium stoloniferum]